MSERLIFANRKFKQIVIEELESSIKMVKSELESCVMNIVRSSEYSDEFPFFESKVEAFNAEKKLMDKQFELLSSKSVYKKLDSNLTFLARLEDVCALVKPDSKFRIPSGLDLNSARENYSQEQLE